MRFDLQLFTEEALEFQTSNQLRKDIRSFRKRIDDHLTKIANPWMSYSDWFSESDKQQGRLEHWRHEIRNFEESIQNRITELEKRGEQP